MFKQFCLGDVKAGFLIFLIALPLCLGIAMASGFPPIAGILTAIIGGLTTSFLGGARLSIKGPAAGLIVIVLAAVTELGGGDLIVGYKKCLAVGVCAAILQIIFSRMRVGKLGTIMPPSVIHGMLAAIGVIIIAKQLHILFGTIPMSKTPLELIAEIPHSIQNINPELAFMGFMTLGIIVGIPLLPYRWIKKIPPALVSLALVLPLALYWHLDTFHSYSFLNRTFEVGPKFLVTLPENLLGSLTFPDFSALSTWVGWKYVLMLSIIGSLESLLTVMALDGMDPKQQKSNPDRDLLALGLGNLISSFLGGLPMISEVVRSKANIDNGAQSAWSNFFHGLFLLLAITCLTGVIHEIPLSALAAMLIFTGYRLASPKEFFKTYKIGSDQLFFFATTMVVTLKTDLLIGVLTGLILKMGLHVFRGAKLSHLFKMPIEQTEKADVVVLKVSGCAIFSNFLYLNRQIQNALKKGKNVLVDVSAVSVVDHTSLIRLNQLINQTGPSRLRLQGLKDLQPVSSHEFGTHRVM